MADSEGAKQTNEACRKLFVFTAPRFETNTNAIQKQAQLKRTHFNWKMTHFEIDLYSSETTVKKSNTSSTIKEKFSSGSTESTEAFSELNLQYESARIRNSVIAYLEDTFSENSRQSSQGFNTNTEDRTIDDNLTPETMPTKQSAQQEYAFSLEQSQKLFDKMQGFVELSIDESISFTSGSQLNTDDFCHTEETQSLSNSSHENMVTQTSPFTKLANCTQHFSTVNVFVVVLQVNPIKEIKIKSGINYGQYIKVASILVGDSTKEYFKLTFWRKSAEWVNSLKEGDVVVAKKIKIEKWNQEFYGQSTYGTTLVNLQRDGGYSCRVPAQWLTIVSQTEAKGLLKWLKCKHPYLMSHKTPPCEDVKFKTLKQFIPNTLVHYRAKIVKVLTYGSSKGKYEFEKRKMNKIVAVALDPESSEEVPICLWGSQADWRYELKSKIGETWCFTFLRVECNTVHGQLCLHTTPRSTKKLKNDEASLFVGQVPLPTPEKTSATFPSISELLKANSNGKATISAGVTKIMYSKTDDTEHTETTIDKDSNLSTVHRFVHDLVYLGCKLCLRALKQDHNGIYMHCSYCIQHNSNYRYGVIYCFKPCVVYLSDKSSSVIAKSCHEATSKFLDIRPQDVLEDSNNKLFERLQHIFNTAVNVKVILKCETVLDENDFIKSQNFELLDLQM